MLVDRQRCIETRRTRSSSIAKDTKPSHFLSWIQRRRRCSSAGERDCIEAWDSSTNSSCPHHLAVKYRRLQARDPLNHAMVFAMSLCELRALCVSTIRALRNLGVFASLRFHCARPVPTIDLADSGTTLCRRSPRRHRASHARSGGNARRRSRPRARCRRRPWDRRRGWRCAHRRPRRRGRRRRPRRRS